MFSTVQPIAIFRNVNGLVFDATFEERHTSELEVTDNPCETGVTISDHAYMKPKRLTISAGVSDVQLYERVSGDPFQGSSARSVVAFELLQQLQETAEPFDIQTGLTLYQNMVCIALRTTQDKDTSKVLIFEADFREVIIVDTQVVKYPPRAKGSATNQGSAKKNKGEQQGKQEVGNKKQSLLKKLSSFFGGS